MKATIPVSQWLETLSGVVIALLVVVITAALADRVILP